MIVKVIDLNDAKFKQFENFITLKLYVKYLKKSYIIKLIFKEIFSYFLNNFHVFLFCHPIKIHMRHTVP